jgi:predicted Zn finger-like uncharacterized protein
MTDKQTQCPECASIYKISVAQLTVAQGMVCCPKCNHSFNALLHLITITHTASKPLLPTQNSNVLPETINNSYDLLEIFDQKVKHSNIDLETYLNNLTYFNTDPIIRLPALNLAQKEAISKEQISKTTYYVTWSSITLVLIIIVIFQLIILNPIFLNNHPTLHSIFTKVCDFADCSNLDKQYVSIKLENMSIQSTPKNKLILGGEITNRSQQNLKMPLLLLTLSKNEQTVFHRIYSPEEYLAPKSIGLQRISPNNPFKFTITLPLARKDFNHYKLQVIRP